ncbi:MAG: hypothetical protein IKD76_07290 [Clostridia bacterium]|nr:hypothetical protein [Clostridia bacterium]MBR2787268.1 hypothetical protein [Clostridia bacterium]
MNKLKEFFGNMPIFQKRVEREIEAKGIKPTEGVKKLELSRQVLRNTVIVVLIIICLVFGGLTYFKNKNNPTPPSATATKKSSEKKRGDGQNGHYSHSKASNGSSDHLVKLSAKERAKEATEAFKAWYESYDNHETVLEINKEALKEGSGGTSPIELSTKLINNLKAKFDDSVSDDFYSSLQTSFNFNPVVVDSNKGLTISKQNDDQSQWLRTWLLDTDKTEQNTKVILRNDFPYEYFDWRKESKNSEKTNNILKEIDWDNDLSYEVVGISLMHSKKNIDSSEIVFIVLKYNEKLSKWQLTGTIGGIL